MCQPGSSCATMRAVAAPPGLTAAGSTVIDHCTGFNFCADRADDPANSNTAAIRVDIIYFILRPGGGKAVKALFDTLVDLTIVKLGRHANRVLYGVRVRPAMADDAHTPYTQQRSTTKLGVIDALLEVRIGGPR